MEVAKDIDAINFRPRKLWQYNAPVGHVLPLSKRPKYFAAMLRFSLSLSPLTSVYLRERSGGVGVAVALCD